jgi:hypothetical protein
MTGDRPKDVGHRTRESGDRPTNSRCRTGDPSVARGPMRSRRRPGHRTRSAKPRQAPRTQNLWRAAKQDYHDRRSPRFARQPADRLGIRVGRASLSSHDGQCRDRVARRPVKCPGPPGCVTLWRAEPARPIHTTQPTRWIGSRAWQRHHESTRWQGHTQSKQGRRWTTTGSCHLTFGGLCLGGNAMRPTAPIAAAENPAAIPSGIPHRLPATRLSDVGE